MICRVVLFQWKENSKEAAEACADQMVKNIFSHEGVKSLTFIGRYDQDIYGTAIVWESKEAADKAADSIRRNALAFSGGNIIGVVEERQLDVYVPNEY